LGSVLISCRPFFDVDAKLAIKNVDPVASFRVLNWFPILRVQSPVVQVQYLTNGLKDGFVQLGSLGVNYFYEDI